MAGTAGPPRASPVSLLPAPPPLRRAARWAVRHRVLLYFLLGLLVLDRAVDAHRQRWRAYAPDEYDERVKGCGRQAYDLIVTGSSPVSEGIDPGVLAGVRWRGQPLERVYNLGVPGSTTSAVWRDLLRGAGEPPRLLVYGITASDLNDSRRRRHGARAFLPHGDLPLWLCGDDLEAERQVRRLAEERVPHLWKLFHYRNGIRLWAADLADGAWPGLCPGAAAEAHDGWRTSAALRRDHGFAPRPGLRGRRLDRNKAAGVAPECFPLLKDYHVGAQAVFLHRLLDWADRHGVSAVLLDMPVSADLERLHPEAFACYRSALAEVERVRGVRVLRAGRDAVGLTDADFGDLIHLNACGTARLSAWLRRKLGGDS